MKKKIIIGLLLAAGLVYAAAQTKFYGDILMQTHRITGLTMNLNDTTTAATKGYVDTNITNRISGKLDKSGGNMTGGLGMAGHRLYGLPTPSSPTDAASKYYVDTAVANSEKGGTYIAFKRGTDYLPLINFNSAFDRTFTGVICRQFSGALTAYVINAEAMVARTNAWFPSKTWKVGEKFQVAVEYSPEAWARTNGTLLVSSANGVVANVGFTFPAQMLPQYKLIIQTDYPDFPVDTRGQYEPALIPVSAGHLRVGVTNINHVAGPNITVAPSSWKRYGVSEAGFPTYIGLASGGYPDHRYVTAPISAGACAWFKVEMEDYLESAGYVLKVEITPDNGYTIYSYGEFYYDGSL